MAGAGLGVSTLLDPEAAAEEACQLALERLGGLDVAVALVVATAAHGSSLPRVASRCSRLLGARVAVGGSVEGIVAPGVEVSAYPAVMVLALAGVDAEAFLVRDLCGDPERAGEEIAAQLGKRLEPDDLVVAIADLLSLSGTRLAAGLGEQLGPATILGTGAAATSRGTSVLWHGEEISSEGIAGFVLQGVPSRLAIAQAGRVVTPPLRVTRARGNWVLALDGRPALDVYLQTARELGLEPGRGGQRSLLVGLCGPKGTEELLLRNVAGFDRDRAAFSVPEPMASGRRLVFAQLDAELARASFVEQLDEVCSPKPAFGLYFNCRARGASLFGEAGVEATCLANAFSDRPIAGLIGAAQLAPRGPGENPAIFTYAGVLALVDEFN
jgi:small ligand-binding sensory domain FIST